MSIEIKSFERGVLVYLVDPVMKRFVYGFFKGIAVQYIDGRPQSLSLVERQKDDGIDLWFSIIVFGECGSSIGLITAIIFCVYI